MKQNHRLITTVAALATLALLAGCGSATASGGKFTPDNSTTNITLEQAARIAYTHAGVDEAKAYDKSQERERDHYEIDFEFDGWEYEYDISLSGEILHTYKEPDRNGSPATQPAATQPAATQPVAQNITLEEAAAIAYAHAGVDPAKARDKSQELENGRYEIDFEFDGYDYEYVVSLTGEILRSEKEPDRDIPKQTQPAATQPVSTQPVAQNITPEEAMAIAYAHAGVTAAQVYDKSCEWEHDHYEIDFDCGDYEYEYRVSHHGDILHSHKEHHDDHHHHSQTPTTPTTPSTRISAEEALTIALNHAGVAKSDTRDRDVEWDDGCWEVSFEAGRTEYEYQISAAGKVLRSEKDVD